MTNPVLERAWADVMAGIDDASRGALIRVLSRLGALDGIYAEAVEDIRADVAGATKRRAPTGKLRQAIALIEAGETKPRVLAAGISRRTYFRARRECQECQARPSRSSV